MRWGGRTPHETSPPGSHAGTFRRTLTIARITRPGGRTKKPTTGGRSPALFAFGNFRNCVERSKSNRERRKAVQTGIARNRPRHCGRGRFRNCVERFSWRTGRRDQPVCSIAAAWGRRPARASHRPLHRSLHQPAFPEQTGSPRPGRPFGRRLPEQPERRGRRTGRRRPAWA